MRLRGVEIERFRSVYAAPQRLGPFEKINLFIGPNNAGKSNVLRYIAKQVHPFLAQKPPKLSTADRPTGGGSPTGAMWMLFDLSADAIREGVPEGGRAIAKLLQSILLRLPNANAENLSVWLPISSSNQHSVVINDEMKARFRHQDHQREVNNVWQQMQGSRGGSFEHWLQEVLNLFVRAQLRPINVVTIPTLRRVGSRLAEFRDEYGDPAGNDAIIDELAALAYPAWDKQEDRARFSSMERFVNDVLSRDDVRIEIPHDKSTVNISMDGRVLPIEALGTGIHEIIMMAARVIVLRDSVVCVEEPESHLHPELQRKFMQFIHRETDNQYFITTHSAHVLDSVPAAVYSVQLRSGSTEFVRSLGAGHRRQICHELGYRPSDLLQSNCLIWVEGPTDRIYLNHWIKSKDESIVEGIHYSIMFYGGRLLSHLSAEEVELDEFVSLLPINRFSAILIDSDKRKAGDRINDSKRRVIAEIERANGIAWLTKGKEIENYLDDDLRDQITLEIHKDALGTAYKNNFYSNALAYLDSKGTTVEKVDKLRFAKAATSKEPNWKSLDLEKRVNDLLAFIRRANKTSHLG